MTLAPERITTARLGDVLDIDNLHARIAGRYIDVRHHRDGGLTILDYSRNAQIEQAWDPETMTCRGLMVTSDGNGISADSLIVARGFMKFFTVDQHDALAAKGVLAPLPAGEPFEVFTKEDGSLGLAYWAPDGRPAISTRGTFHSIQADWATAHLRENPDLEAAVAAMLERGTPCFEIISPVSQIVKVYDFYGLVLLGVLDRATGTDLPVGTEWPGRVVTRHDGLGDYTTLAELAWPNEEGFVIRFASGVRAKTKFAEYVRLHRIVTGMSTTSLWEHLAVADLRDAGVEAAHAVSRLSIDHRFVEALYQRTGDPMETILDSGPREFEAWVNEQVGAIRAAYAERERYYRDGFAALPTGLSRKDLAAHIRTHVPRAEHGVMFALADGRSIAHNVWVDVTPERTTAFAVDLDG